MALATETARVNDRPVAEKLVAEALPLADAIRWLQHNAARVLASRSAGRRGRPFWLPKFSFEVQRQPYGRVLIIGPRNYPLFLPAVQALHALVAGNAVFVKPAPGTRKVMLKFFELVLKAGLDPALLNLLEEKIEAAQEVIAAGIDKVFFTGSSENGRALLATLAPRNIPSVMELSGEDAVVVMADANLDLVERALEFGRRLNGGDSCIAPRRIIALETIADDLAGRLRNAGLAHISLDRVPDETAALELARASEFGLGLSIFTRDKKRARAFAREIPSGFVLINDLIVPTADPRLPFGGVRKSGFGVTRGEEGLLEMTFPHVVGIRRGKFYRHFERERAGDAQLFAAYIQAAHGRGKFRAFSDLFRYLRRRLRE